MRIVHCIEKPFYVLVRVYDAWQTEHRDWRIVGMYTHVDASLLAYRHDGLEEILHVFA